MKVPTKYCPCSFKIVSTRNLSRVVSGKTLSGADYLYFVNWHNQGDESLWREEAVPTFDRAVMLKTGNDVGATIMSMLEIRAPDEPLSSNSELMMLLRSWLGQQFKAKLLELRTAGAILQWLNESADQILEVLGWEFLNSQPKDPEGTAPAAPAAPAVDDLPMTYPDDTPGLHRFQANAMHDWVYRTRPADYVEAGEGLADILTHGTTDVTTINTIAATTRGQPLTFNTTAQP